MFVRSTSSAGALGAAWAGAGGGAVSNDSPSFRSIVAVARNGLSPLSRSAIVASGSDSLAELTALFTPELSNRTTTVNVSKEAVAVLSDTTAVDVTEFTYVVTRPSGSSKPIPAVATSTWVLQDGEWKILQYHQSGPIPDSVSLERLGDAADPEWAASVKGQ